jgi:hypothetical protein
MSTIASQTEIKVKGVLAKCLTYLDELSNLEMTAEDAFDVGQAKNNFRRIVEGYSYHGDIFTMNSFFVTKDHLYVLVRWPTVQDLMEYEWFRAECILYQAFE